MINITVIKLYVRTSSTLIYIELARRLILQNKIIFTYELNNRFTLAIDNAISYWFSSGMDTGVRVIPG